MVIISAKEIRVLITLDVVELIIAFIALFVFTIIFKLVNDNARYLFLMGDLYVIYTFSKTLSSLENEITKGDSNRRVESRTIDLSLEKTI